MKKQLRKYGAGAAVIGAVAGAAALALPATEPTGVQATGSTGTQATALTGAGAAGLTGGAAARAGGAESAGSASARGGHHGAPAWKPVIRNLAASPAGLLPVVVSAARPVRVVGTAVDATGRPVTTVRTATDRAGAAALVADAQRAPGALGVELDVPVSVTATDPISSMQWDLGRTRMAEAWQRSTGAGVVVAVVDSGVESSHPDLAGQVLPGGDFITGLEGPSIDPHGHGTHVAGTVAALTGNGIGVAGVAPDAKILPVRVLGDDGSGYMSDVANGIVYAADRGADVINLSVSATVQVGAVSNAVAYARSKGIVVVAAAGNARRSGSPASYPAADEGAFAVAATDSADNVASYSTQGGYLDISAPGSDIVSTYKGASYGRMSGTSMAAPHVAALAALLRSADRGLTPDAVEQAIVRSSVDLGLPGRDADFGAGRIDAAAALAMVAPPVPASTEPTVSPEPATPTTTAPAEPSTPATTDPTMAPSAPATTHPTPTPSAPAPTATEPAPADTRRPAQAYLVKTGSNQLTVAIRESEGQTVELQWLTEGGWETVHSYSATLVVRLNALTAGRTYRVVVADSANFLGAVSGSVRL